MNNEIELKEEFQPFCLATGEDFSGQEIF